MQARQATAALRIARQILRKDRAHVGALEIVARGQWQLQKFELLIATTRHLIKLDPYNPGYHMLRGAAFQCLGMFGEATKCYARANAEDKSGKQTRSLELISELREWQAGLLSTLLEEDATFRAAFSRDPQAACQSRGFEFLDLPAKAYVGENVSASVTARPS